jgi:hypothetical protein
MAKGVYILDTQGKVWHTGFVLNIVIKSQRLQAGIWQNGPTLHGQ